MNYTTHGVVEFRTAKLEFLKFISSSHEQQEFASSVSCADYASEFYEMWFADWRADSELFTTAFTTDELKILAIFSDKWAEAYINIVQYNDVSALLLNPLWAHVMLSANTALQSI